MLQAQASAHPSRYGLAAADARALTSMDAALGTVFMGPDFSGTKPAKTIRQGPLPINVATYLSTLFTTHRFC